MARRLPSETRRELVASGGAANHPANEPTATERRSWKHVRALIAAHVWLTSWAVVRFLL